MKIIENKYSFPKAEDHIFDVLIEEIVPGDKVIIHAERFENSNFWKTVTVPDTGLILTNSGNVVIEGEHTINFKTEWLPKKTLKYFFGLISRDSAEEEKFITFFAQGKFKDELISHLLKPNMEGKLQVLKNIL